MILDAHNQFSSAQALTTTAISENVIDLGPLTGFAGSVGYYGSNSVRDIFAGKPVGILLQVVASLTDADGAPTLDVTVESDSAAGLDSAAVVHFTLISGKLEAALTANTIYKGYLPPDATVKRYLGLRYTVGVAAFDGGTVNAWLVPGGFDDQRYYASGFQNGA